MYWHHKDPIYENQVNHQSSQKLQRTVKKCPSKNTVLLYAENNAVYKPHVIYEELMNECLNEVVQGSKVLTLWQDTCHRHSTYTRTTLQAMPKKIGTSPYKTQAQDNKQRSLGFLTNFLRCSKGMTLIRHSLKLTNYVHIVWPMTCTQWMKSGRAFL